MAPTTADAGIHEHDDEGWQNRETSVAGGEADQGAVGALVRDRQRLVRGQKGKHDDAWRLQKFTSRGPRSTWSKINREKALALIARGEMKPPGLAEVERAKQDGRWKAAYESQGRALVPTDLLVALNANERAAQFFNTLDARNRYAVLFRIHAAKKPAMRAMRIEKFVAMLARREKLHGYERSQS